MTATDMNTGTHAWMVPTGNGNRVRHLPILKALNLPPVGGDSTLSGPLLTKTLLIYALTAGGTSDGPRSSPTTERPAKGWHRPICRASPSACR